MPIHTRRIRRIREYILASTVAVALMFSQRAAAGDRGALVSATYTTVKGTDSFIADAPAGYVRLYSRFTTHVPPADAGDKFGCKRFTQLAASLDDEDITEFIGVGLGILNAALKTQVGPWVGLDSVATVSRELMARSTASVAQPAKDPPSVKPAGLHDSYGYPVVLISAPLSSLQPLTRDNSPGLADALSIGSRRHARVEGRIQYQLRLRPPYLWHEAVLDLRFFEGPQSIKLAELTKTVEPNADDLLKWAQELGNQINMTYADALQKTELKRLADITLAPDEARLLKFGATAREQWVALLASRCNTVLTAGK